MSQSVVIEEGHILDESTPNDPDLNSAFYSFIDQLQAENDSGGTIAVFEVPVDATDTPRPQTLNKTKLFTVPVGSMSFDDILDKVQKEFMKPGQKMTVQLLGTQNGKRGVRFNKMVSLRRSNLETGVIPSAPGGSEMTEMLRLIMTENARSRQENREFMQSIVNTLRAGAGPVGNPMEQGLSIAKMMMESMSAMMVRTGVAPPPQKSMVEQLTEFAALGKVMRGIFNDGGGRDREPKEDGFAALKEMAVPLLSALAAKERANAAIAEANAKRLPAPTPAPSPAPVASASATTAPESNESPTVPESGADSLEEDTKMKLLTVLNEGLPVLVQVAAQQQDAKQAAKLVLNAFPETDLPLNSALHSMLLDPDCLKQMTAICPAVAAHEEWFTELIAALLAEFEPDERVPQS